MLIDDNNELKWCDPELVRLIKYASKSYDVDIRVLTVRQEEKYQNEAYNSGHSELKYPLSAHNLPVSEAVDVMPNNATWDEIYKFKRLGAHIKKCAERLDIDIIWGGDWKTLKDYPHFEIKHRFGIATLTCASSGEGTENAQPKDQSLRLTIENYIEYADKLPDVWAIYCNSYDKHMKYIIEEKKRDHPEIEWRVVYNENNMGVSVGINRVNEMVSDCDYVLFLEDDWILLPNNVSGVSDLAIFSSIQFLKYNQEYDTVVLRRYVNDIENSVFFSPVTQDDRRIEFGEDIFYTASDWKYVNTPHIRKNKVYEDKIFPLNEAKELKGSDIWGQGENTARNAWNLKAVQLNVGIFLHHINAYELAIGDVTEWNSWCDPLPDHLQQDLTEFPKHQCDMWDTGSTSCKYGWFNVSTGVCQLCRKDEGPGSWKGIKNHGEHYKRWVDYKNKIRRDPENFIETIDQSNSPRPITKEQFLKECEEANEYPWVIYPTHKFQIDV